jgi:hypothetical protein
MKTHKIPRPKVRIEKNLAWIPPIIVLLSPFYGGSSPFSFIFNYIGLLSLQLTENDRHHRLSRGTSCPIM